MGDRRVTPQTAFYFLVSVILLPLAGCAMCAGPFDADYSAEGGVWERHDPSHGRVGSAFSDAGAPRDETAVLEGVPEEAAVSPEAYYEASPDLDVPLQR
jgi:hypothetical protein